MPPETRYAKKGETSIAYQVVGEGPVDIVFVNGVVSHMALFRSDAAANAMFRRLTSFSRLILFDKPGTGLSDPVAGPPSLEQRVEDVRVVMDAVGLERAAIIGFSEGGTSASLFAATYPERCQALVLLETAAKWVSAPDYLPESRAAPDHMGERLFAAAGQWGEETATGLGAPTAPTLPVFWQMAGSPGRLCASAAM